MADAKAITPFRAPKDMSTSSPCLVGHQFDQLLAKLARAISAERNLEQRSSCDPDYARTLRKAELHWQRVDELVIAVLDVPHPQPAARPLIEATRILQDALGAETAADYQTAMPALAACLARALDHPCDEVGAGRPWLQQAVESLTEIGTLEMIRIPADSERPDDGPQITD